MRDFAALVGRFVDLYNDRMFQPISPSVMKDAEALEDEIDARRKQLNESGMRRMGQPDPDLKSEILNLEINNHLEKIGNYALNVVQALYLMARM